MSFSAGNSGSPSYFPDGYNGSQLANIETISATRILTSSDRRIQILTPNGATRIVQLPSSTVLGEEWVFINPSTSSQSLTITSSNTATIVTIVPGSTVKVNALVASPSAPSDWVLNSLGNTVGPGSSVDNAIVRFDGTTGKLVQNSGATIDDNGVIRMVATVGNPIYTRYDQTTNSGKAWRAGHTGAVGGFTSYDIYNETDGIVAFSAASGGSISLTTTSGYNLILKKTSGSAMQWWADNLGTSNTFLIDNVSGTLRIGDHAATSFGLTMTQAGLTTLTDTSGAGHILRTVSSSAVFAYGRITSSAGFGYLGADSTDAFKIYAGGTGSNNPAAVGTLLGSATQAGVWTLGPNASTATNCVVNGAASVTHGVVFPASQNAVANANTLDDYEEGTFTPNFLWGGAASGITYGNRVATYSKIGNRVFFHMFVDYSIRGSSTGQFTITGLPFTSVATASGGHSAVAMWFSNVSLTNYVITGYVSQSSTTIFLNASPINASAGSTIAISDTAFPANNGGFMITGHYITA
jgi:hypothetical protein